MLVFGDFIFYRSLEKKIMQPAHTGFVFFLHVATFIFRKNKRYSSCVIHTHMVFMQILLFCTVFFISF